MQDVLRDDLIMENWDYQLKCLHASLCTLSDQEASVRPGPDMDRKRAAAGHNLSASETHSLEDRRTKMQK